MVSHSLLARLARTPRLTELLPPLHEHALTASGGSCSLLFEFNPRNEAWYATSGLGLDELGADPWTPDAAQRLLIETTFRNQRPVLVTDAGAEVPYLVMRLGAPAILLLPLAHGDRRFGMLVIGYGSLPPPDADWTDVIEASHAFVTVLELSRLRQQEELRRELRVLLDEFDDTLSSTLNLPTSLDVFCQRARRLFSADRTSVWIHDRLSHSLVLRASSDPSHMPRGDRIDTADPAAPAATGMRKSRSVITASAGDAPTGTLTVPLRGRRRALGTIVLEGVFFQTGSELDLVERADELGAGISGAIEHLQLLEDAGRARRELDTGEVGSAESSVEVDQHTLQERRQQSDKLAALGQLIAGIAHELNNPLQSVLGHLELMRTASTLSPAMRRDVRTVYREADRAAKIVRNLLVFAGSRRVVRRPVSLHAVLQKVLALRAQACRSLHIEVVRQYDEKLPRVLSDPLLLHQAFLNVVMNAEQAIAATGRPGRIEITTSSADGRIFATVRDSGDGIPADALSRVFEPFYTTKEVGKGSGLGLAITYGIVLEQGGDVAVVNHPSGGAAFTIELPISQTRSAAPVG